MGVCCFMNSCVVKLLQESCKVSGNVVSNRSCFACGVERERNKRVGYVGARRTMTSCRIENSLGREGGGGMLFYERLRR